MRVHLCLLYIISALLNKLKDRFPHFVRTVIAVLSLPGSSGTCCLTDTLICIPILAPLCHAHSPRGLVYEHCGVT